MNNDFSGKYKGIYIEETTLLWDGATVPLCSVVPTAQMLNFCAQYFYNRLKVKKYLYLPCFIIIQAPNLSYLGSNNKTPNGFSGFSFW